jgi:DNA-binding NtrC family response regulator
MSQHYQILIVDDESSITTLLKEELEEHESYQVDLAFDGAEGINLIKKRLYDVILLDMKMPRLDGREVLQFIQAHSPSSQVIILSQFSDLKMAVECTRLGAYEVLGKPYDVEQIEQTILRAIERKNLSIDNKLLPTEPDRKAGTIELVGKSKALQDMIESSRRVASSDSNVLIYGQSGTGKELVAKFIHHSSIRRDRPFVHVDCSSIPPTRLESDLFGQERGGFRDAFKGKRGLIDAANGGTLFLDEVGDLSLTIQPRLLNFLETGDFRRVDERVELKADVRIISTTNKDLQREVQAGRFRDDLLYRLNVVTLHVPPLKHRREDIPELVAYFLRRKLRTSERKWLSDRALEALMMYDWPGNVRELEHVIEGAVILSAGQIIDVADLHLNDPHSESIPESLSIEAFEKRHIQKVLKMFKGNRKQTAEALNISEKGLYLKIKEYGILIN